MINSAPNNVLHMLRIGTAAANKSRIGQQPCQSYLVVAIKDKEYKK